MIYQSISRLSRVARLFCIGFLCALAGHSVAHADDADPTALPPGAARLRVEHSDFPTGPFTAIDTGVTFANSDAPGNPDPGPLWTITIRNAGLKNYIRVYSTSPTVDSLQTLFIGGVVPENWNPRFIIAAPPTGWTPQSVTLSAATDAFRNGGSISREDGSGTSPFVSQGMQVAGAIVSLGRDVTQWPGNVNWIARLRAGGRIGSITVFGPSPFRQLPPSDVPQQVLSIDAESVLSGASTPVGVFFNLPVLRMSVTKSATMDLTLGDSGRLDNLTIGGDLSGALRSMQLRAPENDNRFGSIVVQGSFGGRLRVPDDGRNVPGRIETASGSIRELIVNGSIGRAQTGIAPDGTFILTPADVSITAGANGRIGSIRAPGGEILGTVSAPAGVDRVIAGGRIGRVGAVGGITSTSGSIREVQTGTSCEVDISAPSGRVSNVDIGTDLVGTIRSKDSPSQLIVRRDVKAGSTITLDRGLDATGTVSIGRSLEPGAVIRLTSPTSQPVTSLAGQIIVNATSVSPGSSSLFGGTVEVRGSTGSLLQTISVADYTTVSSVFGGGAVGLVPYRIHKQDGFPATTAAGDPGRVSRPALVGTPSTPGVVPSVQFYGPIEWNGTGAPVAVMLRRPFTLEDVDVTDQFEYSLTTTNLRRLEIRPKCPGELAQGRYTVTTITTGSPAPLTCAGEGVTVKPSVAADSFVFDVSVACNPADIADNGSIPGADGCVDNGDFSLFISQFFSAPVQAGCTGVTIPCAASDIADNGSIAGADGYLDNGDFSLFFASFFNASCTTTCGITCPSTGLSQGSESQGAGSLPGPGAAMRGLAARAAQVGLPPEEVQARLRALMNLGRPMTESDVREAFPEVQP
jgi:hypothetical protein